MQTAAARVRGDGMSRLSRFSLNQMTVKQLSRAPSRPRAAREPGIGASACGATRSRGVRRRRRPRSSSATRACASPRLCRGGFFTATDPGSGRARSTTTARAIDEAATLGTDTLVLVSGGLPAGSRDLRGARERVADGIAAVLADAAARGVRLAIEPLHPMYCADRCVVSTLGQALDLAERFPAEQVGVVVDTYHVWWDRYVRATRSPARADPHLPARRLGHPAARGRAARPRPARRRPRRPAAPAPRGRGGRLHRPDRGRGLQRALWARTGDEVLAGLAAFSLSRPTAAG